MEETTIMTTTKKNRRRHPHKHCAAALLLGLGAALAGPLTPAVAAAAASASAQDANAVFAALSDRALAHWTSVGPINATFLGEHRYDSEIDDLSAAGRAKALAGSQRLLAELDRIDPASLSRENQIDAALLRNQLRYDAWGWQVSQDWAWAPPCRVP